MKYRISNQVKSDGKISDDNSKIKSEDQIESKPKEKTVVAENAVEQSQPQSSSSHGNRNETTEEQTMDGNDDCDVSKNKE